MPGTGLPNGPFNNVRARSFDLEQRPGTIPARNDIQIYISVNEWNDSWPGINLPNRTAF